MNPIVLGSTSVYRRELLERIGLPFQTSKPDFDEATSISEALQLGKSPLQIAEALSRGKGESLLKKNDLSESLVISGDQLVHFEGQILGKSKTFEKAFQQLTRLSGQTHELITAVTLHFRDQKRHLNHVTTLKMKNLTPPEIESYLRLDEPFDCAGSYKIEKSGVVLFEKIECTDFTAIQGLPLLWITNQMRELGYEFFKR